MARPTLNGNVKYKRLIRLLAMPRPYVRGLLETLWDVANESGNPVMGSAEDVEIAAEWDGEPGKFFEAMKACRLIDPLEGDRWEIHDYWDHAPEYVRKRAAREASRIQSGKSLSDLRSEAAKARWEPKNNATGMQTSATCTHADANGMQKSALPHPHPHPLPKTEDTSVVVVEEFQKAWNALGQPFPKILRINGKRLKALQARSRDAFWRDNWRAALAMLPATPFLRGEGKEGWIADADWFLQPDAVQKTIEGKYKPANRNGTAPHNPDPYSPEAAAEVLKKRAKMETMGGRI